MLSPVRLSSVCRLSSVTLVHPTQAVQIFGNISTAFGHPLTSTENFTEIKFASSIFAGHRCLKSLFYTCTAAQHTKFYNLQVHFDEAVRYIWCHFLVISHYMFHFQLSQRSVATLIRWGGWSSYCRICRSSLNLTVKTASKSVDFWRSYRQK